jgi:hypothetical protein
MGNNTDHHGNVEITGRWREGHRLALEVARAIVRAYMKGTWPPEPRCNPHLG